MNVFTYWAGDKPKWIDTCLNSIARCCTDGTKFHLLTPETIQNEETAADEIAKDTLPKRWLDLPPGVGTDCLRAALLYGFGGLWCDADTVCISDPGNLVKFRHYANQFLYSKWPAKPDRVIAGYIYSPAHHPIAWQWYRFVVEALNHAENIGWGELGEKILTLIVNMSPSAKSSFQMPIETFMPIDIDTNVERYFRDGSPGGMVTADTIAFGLNYSWMMHNKKDVMLSFPEKTRGSLQTIHQLLHSAERKNNAK